MNLPRARFLLLISASVCCALITCGVKAQAQSVDDQPKVPAAWVGRSPGAKGISGLADLRGFYHHVAGVGGRRNDWSGSELLSYFDAVDGLSGAFVLRHEARDQAGTYGTLMLIPKVGPREYLVSSLGVGDGAPFQPVTRLDLQLRGFLPWYDDVMYDVGGFGTWWTQGRRQLAQSNAVIFWWNPYILEVRATANLTDPGFGSLRVNPKGSAVLLWGQDKSHWLMTRIAFGTEPENAPGIAFAETTDIFIISPALGHRQWITPSYGVAGEIELFHQWGTWTRLGVTASMFASF